jgi:hypothetical protein
MKTTTIGRIGALVAGAAMLGTAVASAMAGAAEVPAGLEPSFFIDNGQPVVQVVIGEKAQASDGVAAGKIAALIGNKAWATVSDSKTDTVEVAGGTVTCEPAAGQCAAAMENAQGEVTLSWEASGLVGDLEQREMACSIYNDDSTWMQMTELDDGGDYGSWCDDNEIYGPEDTVGSTLVSICDVTSGTDQTILLSDEFANEICTICYNYCDIALGCEPHLMSEWVNISCDKIRVGYDCEEQELKLVTTEEGALTYNLFTDDILVDDILDDDDALIGQTYLGRIIIGQHTGVGDSNWYVESLDESEITVVLGNTGSTDTSTPMEYTTPTGDTYSIKLVGAQTIEEVGVVDVTLEVTYGGVTEQIVSGISGTPTVGDLKIKLQRGSAASNVITGEQSFSADLLVWFLPSEKTWEVGEEYDETGVGETDNDVPLWKLFFNGEDDATHADDLLVTDVEALEEGELLYEGHELPDDIQENEQWDSCYDEVSDDDNATMVLRWITWELQGLGEALPAGDLIQLPFNDGEYLLSDLKFGYQGLMDENFLALEAQDTTVIEISLDSIDVTNSTNETEEFYRQVTVDFVDQWGDSMEDVRLDEGPYWVNDINSDGVRFISGGYVVEITSVEYWDDDVDVVVEYRVKNGASWEEFEVDDDDIGDACNMSDEEDPIGVLPAFFNGSMISAVEGDDYYFSGELNATCNDEEWWLVRYGSDDEDDWAMWINTDDDEILEMAETNNEDIDTEFKDEIYFSAANGIITIDGESQTGGEDDIVIKLNQTANVSVTCQYGGMDTKCDEIFEPGEAADGGTAISLSGATVVIDADEIEEPEDSDAEETVISKVTVTLPENEVRPTLFFGTSTTLNESSITITDADQGTEVNIGGVPVMVDDFGVTGSVTGGGVVGGNATILQCPSQTASCSVDYETVSVKSLAGYSLVVLDKNADQSKNLVLIGGPSVNILTKDLTTVDALKGGAQIALSSKKLLVAGYEADDTTSAAQTLIAWLEAL